MEKTQYPSTIEWINITYSYTGLLKNNKNWTSMYNRGISQIQLWEKWSHKRVHTGHLHQIKVKIVLW